MKLKLLNNTPTHRRSKDLASPLIGSSKVPKRNSNGSVTKATPGKKVVPLNKPKRKAKIHPKGWWEDIPIWKRNCFNSHYLDPRSSVGFAEAFGTSEVARDFLNHMLHYLRNTKPLNKFKFLMKRVKQKDVTVYVSPDDPIIELKDAERFFIDCRRNFNTQSVGIYSLYLDRHYGADENRSYVAIVLADSIDGLQTTGPVTFAKFNPKTKSFAYLKPSSRVCVAQKFLFIDVKKFPENDSNPFLTWCRAIYDPNLFFDLNHFSNLTPELHNFFYQIRESLHYTSSFISLRKRQETIVDEDTRDLRMMNELEHNIYIDLGMA